jgi:hypothetical protein
MKKLSVFLIALNFTAAYAQEKKGVNHFSLSYAMSYYADKNSIQYDGLPPDGNIHGKNLIRGTWRLQYERVTRYGIDYGGGIKYGIRPYKINKHQLYKNFDPLELTGADSYFGYAFHSGFFGTELFVGYRKQFSKKWSAIARIGTSVRFTYGGKRGVDTFYHEYQTIGGTTKSVPATVVVLKNKREPLPSYEFYLGLERDANYRYLKSLSIGIEGSRGVWMWGRNEYAVIYSSQSVNQILTSKETFIDRNISLGLRIGVGLWK